MSIESKEDFTYLEISRPVNIEGSFLDKVRHYGNEIFGDDYPAIVTTGEYVEPVDEIGSVGGLQQDTKLLEMHGTAAPRLSPYNEGDLQVTLLHRRVPSDMHSASFLWVASRVLANGTRVARPIKRDGQIIPLEERGQPKYRTSPLYDQLDRVGLEFDITPAEQNAVPLRSESFGPSNDLTIDEHGLELELIPSPSDPATMMLIKQSRLCFRALASWSKKAAYPAGRQSLSIPFTRMPADATFEDRRDFTKVIHDLFPVNVILGEVATKINDRHREQIRDVR